MLEIVKQQTVRGVTIAVLKDQGKYDVVYCQPGNLEKTIEASTGKSWITKKRAREIVGRRKIDERLILSESQAHKRFDTLISTIQDKNITIVWIPDKIL